jgi:ribonuclease HI
MSRSETVIYTDGACRGNPGPGGWGALLRHDGHEKRINGYETQTTNNRMELTAAIRGLQALKGSQSVHIFTDSTYVKQGITVWIINWKKRSWKTAARQEVKNADLWRELDLICSTHSVRWSWVRGHSGDEGNEIADMLATSAIDEGIQARGRL